MFMKVFTVILSVNFFCIEVGSFELSIDRVGKTSFQVIVWLHFVDAHKIHYFKDAVGNTAGTGDGDFHIGQPQAKIIMYEITEAALLVDPFELIKPGAVCHKPSFRCVRRRRLQRSRSR